MFQIFGGYIACLLVYVQWRDLILSAESALTAAGKLEEMQFTATGTGGILALYAPPGAHLGLTFVNEFVTVSYPHHTVRRCHIELDIREECRISCSLWRYGRALTRRMPWFLRKQLHGSLALPSELIDTPGSSAFRLMTRITARWPFGGSPHQDVRIRPTIQ